MNMKCELCNKTLAGGLDTYGWPGNYCWDCYVFGQAGGDCGESWYGLAPHHHDESITGSIIGSTVLDPLPEPNQFGEYEIDGLVFVPDPEVPGCGIWFRKIPVGWR